MSNSYTDEELKKIISNYKKSKEKDRKKYEKKKDDPNFMRKNRNRALAYHEKHKDERKLQYASNKPFNSAKSLYNYYVKHERSEEFIKKHPDKVIILHKGGLNILN